MEADMKLWLNELNDVFFDMGNVLDEWITRVLKHQMEKQEIQSAEAHVPTKKKVCFPCPSSCFRFLFLYSQQFCNEELLEHKRFLLILDDVWYPKSNQQEELIKPLQSGAKGSEVEF